METILSFGLTPLSPSWHIGKRLLHLPLIEVCRCSLLDPLLFASLTAAPSYSHLLFTSKVAVEFFFSALRELDVAPPATPLLLSVGKGTAGRAQSFLPEARQLIAPTADAEGMVELLNHPLVRCGKALFWPHAGGARPLIAIAAAERELPFTSSILYDTVRRAPGFSPDFSTIDQLFFSSPSTVEAFFHFFGRPANHLKLLAIGPETARSLRLRDVTAEISPM